MELMHATAATITVTFTRRELEIVNNALNEVCNGIDVYEFETRLGASREEVKALLEGIHRVLQRASPFLVIIPLS